MKSARQRANALWQFTSIPGDQLFQISLEPNRGIDPSSPLWSLDINIGPSAPKKHSSLKLREVQSSCILTAGLHLTITPKLWSIGELSWT
jgi:hypothetical protein